MAPPTMYNDGHVQLYMTTAIESSDIQRSRIHTQQCSVKRCLLVSSNKNIRRFSLVEMSQCEWLCSWEIVPCHLISMELCQSHGCDCWPLLQRPRSAPSVWRFRPGSTPESRKRLRSMKGSLSGSDPAVRNSEREERSVEVETRGNT